MYSYIQDWTLTGLSDPYRETDKSKKKDQLPPQQLRFCHWELVKCLSDFLQPANDHRFPGGYTAAQQVTVI